MERGAKQVGGHAGSFQEDGNRLLKECEDTELEFYERLQLDPSLAKFAPKFYGTRENAEHEKRLVLENLSAGMTEPVIMDVKMGTRSFHPDEDKLDEERTDLLEKMLKVDPAAASDEERQRGITKRRYMKFRDDLSSTALLGVRVEGIKHVRSDEIQMNFKEIHSAEEVQKCIEVFLSFRREVGTPFLQQMIDLRGELEESSIFRHHTFIGSSLLFVYDVQSENGAPVLRMIDFAKTRKSEAVIPHTFDEQSTDGYLYGLQKLIGIWSTAVHQPSHRPSP